MAEHDGNAVIFDFDGVLHSYKSGWQGIANIPDAPVEGVVDEIAYLREHGWKVIVVSSRCREQEGIDAIKAWLLKYGIAVDDVLAVKPPHKVVVDDRAICFNGYAAGLASKVMSFKSWTDKKTAS